MMETDNDNEITILIMVMRLPFLLLWKTHELTIDTPWYVHRTKSGSKQMYLSIVNKYFFNSKFASNVISFIYIKFI
jgi:hypothetical protein